MSTAREQILGGIRRGLGREALAGADLAAVHDRLTVRRRNPVPARAAGDRAANLRLFVEMAEAAAATVAQLQSLEQVPAAVAAFLRQENLPARLVQAPVLADQLPWEGQPALEVRAGVPHASDDVGLTPAFAGVAETGTLVTLSGAATPSTLNFVPDTHIVVLRAADVVGPYEDAFDRMRAATAETGMPRSVNLITGPSRTGDIEQQIVLGAHGPRRLHILFIEDGD